MTTFSPDIRAVFPAADFLHLAQFAITQMSRPYLHGVHIAPTTDGAHMVATDGHRMGILRLPATEGYCAPSPDHLILSHTNKAFMAALKDTRKYIHWVVIRTDTIEVRRTDEREGPAPSEVVDSGLVMQTFPAKALLVDGTFPEWRRVVPTLDGPTFGGRADGDAAPTPDYPKGRPVFYAGVNPALFKGMTRGGEPSVSFDWGGAGAVMVATDDPRFLGVVMPIRNGMSPNEIAARRAAVLG